MRQVNFRTLLIAVALTAIIVGTGAYLYQVETGRLNTNLQDFPTGATYVIKTDGTSIRAIRYDGWVQFSGTDAYTVIQSAINATTASQGGSIVLTDGSYVIRNTLRLWRYITLSGINMEGVQLVAGFDGNMINMTTRPGDSNLIGFVTVKDLTLFGNIGGGYTRGVAIEDVNFSDITIDHVFIDGFPGDGIRFDTRFYLRVTNSWIESNRGDGIHGNGGSYAFITNNVIFNNYNGIGQSSSTTSQYGWLISNNRVVKNANDGIKVGANACCDAISGNNFEQNANGVELVAGGWATRVIGNYFNMNDAEQLKINSTENIVVDANTFDHAIETSLYNIWTWSAAHTVITNNNILVGGRSGNIYINGSRSGLMVVNNPGLNPFNRIFTPFDTEYGFIGLNQVNATAPVPGKTYTVAGCNLLITSVGGSTTITVKEGEGNTLLYGSSLNNYYLPVGYTISWSSVTNVTVLVYGT